MMKDVVDIHSVLRELHIISGFRISIHDTSFREVEAYPKEIIPFCNYIQQRPDVKRLCQENDRKAFKEVQKTEETYFYQCHLGLYEAVSPLYHFGVLCGYLMMGQTIDTLNSNRDAVLAKSLRYQYDQQALKSAVSSIPSSTKERIDSCITLLKICSEYITLTNHSTLSDKHLSVAVKEYLTGNYSEKITSESLCRIFMCSKSTLMRTFKKTYGQTINQYLTRIRLEHAAEMLKYTNRTVYDISQSCGISEQNYFSKLFLKYMGESPTSYRCHFQGMD